MLASATIGAAEPDGALGPAARGPAAMERQAKPLDLEGARQVLSIKPGRNPVKSSSPVVARRYEKRAVKGMEVETDVEVIRREDGVEEEHRLVSVPILFVVKSDMLLDGTSRANVERMAALLGELANDQNARFVVQGHTSAEGDENANQVLSERRAERICGMLTERGVPAGALRVLGLGESCARVPAHAPEPELQRDRRVLIVRMQ